MVDVEGAVVAEGDEDEVVVELLLPELQPVKSKPTVMAPLATSTRFVIEATLRPT